MSVHKWTFLGAVVGGLALLSTAQGAIVVADLAADYADGSDGQTTDDVGLPGTLSGAWNYYQDADGVIDDSSAELLTHDSAVGGTASNGDPGYQGTEVVFGILPMPIVTAGQVFTDAVHTTPPPAGFLQVHPGGDTHPFLAMEYVADTALSGLTLEYELDFGTLGANGNVDYSILQVTGGTASTLVGATNLAGSPAGATGPLSVAVGDMAAGDSLWFLLDRGDVSFDDATNVRLTLTQVPEPATLALLGGLAMCGVLAWRQRKK